MDNVRGLLSRKRPLSLFLLGILCLALAIVIIFIKDYGLSLDEIIYYQFGAINLNVIEKFIYGLPFDNMLNFYDLKYYGTAYLNIGSLIVSLVQKILPTANVYDTWHILNFSIFLCGAWLIFVLGKRFVSEKAAFFGALIYLTQPLLWGHGIINPKDIPFMVFFLAAVTFGVIAVDKISESRPAPQEERKGNHHKWSAFSKVLLILLGVLFLFCAADRLTSNSLTRPLIDTAIDQIQSAQSGSFLSPIQAKIAGGEAAGISIDAYMEKMLKLVNLVEFLVISLTFLAAFILLMIRLSTPYRWMILAGIFLGLTSSIRILGPAAGGLIFLYALFKLRKKSIPYLLVYLGAALPAMYISWPYLWVNPIGRYIDCFKIMVDFPWAGTLLFNGNEYYASNLPWYYLPDLMGIQFTLPLVLLAIFGTVLLVIRLSRSKKNWPDYFLILAWFYLPFVLTMLLKPTMYDNFRQFLFIVPPLFIFAAIGFEALINRIKKNWLRAALPILLLLPGIAAGIWLHPYEYVYYNGLVGWTGNVGTKYENDYWETAACEAGNYLTASAPDGSQIAFTNSIFSWMFKNCANPDFQLLVERAEISKINPDYSVIYTRYGDDQDYYRSMKTIKTIGRGKTVFLVIKAK
jgi:hypothetical protein